MEVLRVQLEDPHPVSGRVRVRLCLEGGQWHVITIRPLLLVLAAAAEYQLQQPKNTAKGGWARMPVKDLFWRATQEMDEVELALHEETPIDGEQVLLEIGDVLNMLMMVLDNSGYLMNVPGERN